MSSDCYCFGFNYNCSYRFRSQICNFTWRFNGLLNVIPYIGICISLLISCFIAFATGTVSTCIYVAIGYVIVHIIDGNIVLPFVVGSKVKINALFSFIGILLGEHLWGISGMFLCIPAIAIIKIIFERVEGLKPWGKPFG